MGNSSNPDSEPTPAEIREMAEKMRGLGFDALADRLEEGADLVEAQNDG